MSTITYARNYRDVFDQAIESTDPLEQMFIDTCKDLGFKVSFCHEAESKLQVLRLSSNTAVALLDLLREQGFEPTIGQSFDGTQWVVAL